jgi:hypothetical protein
VQQKCDLVTTCRQLVPTAAAAICFHHTRSAGQLPGLLGQLLLWPWLLQDQQLPGQSPILHTLPKSRCAAVSNLHPCWSTVSFCIFMAVIKT